MTGVRFTGLYAFTLDTAPRLGIAGDITASGMVTLDFYAASAPECRAHAAFSVHMPGDCADRLGRAVAAFNTIMLGES
jgi:hypothetical protein